MATLNEHFLKTMPLVAILRGVQPHEVLDIAAALYEAGIRIIEVPLNSPDPFTSIELLAEKFDEKCLIGAGTVLSKDDLKHLADCGGKLVVTPNTYPDVLDETTRLGLTALPGVATATDAFTAIRHGAQYLKLFPAATYGTGHLKALMAVIPKSVSLLAVGGVSPVNMTEWLEAGCKGFGLGSDLYKPGDTAKDAHTKAEKAVEVYKNFMSKGSTV